MSSYVLDASALMAYINDESGGDVVAEALRECTISATNLTEVFSKLIRAGMEPEETQDVLRQCCPNVTPVNREQAETAGIIHAVVAKLNVSYADSACLALGATLNKPILTADHKWQELDLDIDIQLELIREQVAS